MGMFVNQYMTKAKKFEVAAKRVERGIQLDINTFEGLRLEMTDEQAETIVGALGKVIAKGGAAPAAREDDGY